jgi:hypothetical protein
LADHDLWHDVPAPAAAPQPALSQATPEVERLRKELEHFAKQNLAWSKCAELWKQRAVAAWSELYALKAGSAQGDLEYVEGYLQTVVDTEDEFPALRQSMKPLLSDVQRFLQKLRGSVPEPSPAKEKPAMKEEE